MFTFLPVIAAEILGQKASPEVGVFPMIAI